MINLEVSNVIRVPMMHLNMVQIRDRFTYENPVFKKARSLGHSTRDIPGWIPLYRIQNSTVVFPRGLLKELWPLLPAVQLVDGTVINNAQLPKLNTTLFDFQETAVQRMLRRNQGVLVSDCGSGKTIMLLSLIFRRKQRTIVLVHTKDLAEQWCSRVEELSGIVPGRIASGTFQPGDITIAMVQTLFKKRLPADFYDQFGCVCLDEAHHAPAQTFNDLIQRFRARFRYGATATLTGRSDGRDFLIPAVLGSSVRIERAGLIEQHHIMRPVVNVVETGFHNGLADSYGALLNAICADEPRNQQILRNIAKEVKNGRICLALSERVKHAQYLSAQFNERYPEIPSECITGRDHKARRTICIQGMREKRLKVVFSTRIADEGLDVPNLGALFLTCPIRSTSKLQQQVGRVLRVHPGKLQPIVYDYYDKLNSLAASQFRTREQFYKSYGVELTYVE